MTEEVNQSFKSLRSKEEYYRIAFNLRRLNRKSVTYTYTATISEPFEDFIKRNESEVQSLSIIFISKCDKEEYESNREFNHSLETYVNLLQRDLKQAHA